MEAARVGASTLPFVSQKLGIAYFPIPKNGGTSIRHALFKLEHGVDYEPVRTDGTVRPLWIRYPSIAFKDLQRDKLAGLEKIAVVRDPVDRLVSAYRNRVQHYREIEAADVAAEALDPRLPKMPSFDVFCRCLLKYRAIESIRHHTQPQSLFLGDDLSYFDRVFRFEALGDLESYLSERAGFAVKLPHLRGDGMAKAAIPVSEANLQRIAIYYQRDYELLGSIYPPQG